MDAENFELLTDEQLAELVRRGNQSAMGTLYNRYFGLVLQKCMSFAKNDNDANDMAQDVMLRVMEKIGTFKGHSKFGTWLYTITFNYCTDLSRKKKGKLFGSFESRHDLVDCSEQALESAIELELKEERARMALASLESQDYQLLLLKYQGNKSIQDLQLTYQISASAVKMRLLRARAKAISVYQTSEIIAA